jgi:hypothetical protein
MGYLAQDRRPSGVPMGDDPPIGIELGIGAGSSGSEVLV